MDMNLSDLSDSDEDNYIKYNKDYKGISRMKEKSDFVSKIFETSKTKLCKTVVVIIVFFLFLIVKLSGIYSEVQYSKPQDKLFDATSSINKKINEDRTLAYAWEIFNCIALDSLFFLISGVFIFKSKSYRTLVSILMFYLVRAVLQSVETSPFPDGFYWENPGFPSLLNMYGKQSDFFYSGHIGFCVFCTIEFFSCDMHVIGVYGIFVCIINFITLICFRVHYTIDLFTGLVMSHYIYNMRITICTQNIINL